LQNTIGILQPGDTLLALVTPRSSKRLHTCREWMASSTKALTLEAWRGVEAVEEEEVYSASVAAT
jgi:hypothetical protein